MSNTSSIIIQFKHNQSTYEVYECPQTLQGFRDLVILKIGINNFKVCWKRKGSQNQISVVDDSDWAMCLSTQKNYQQDFKDEIIVAVEILEEREKISRIINSNQNLLTIENREKQPNGIEKERNLQEETIKADQNEQLFKSLNKKEVATVEYLVEKKLCQLYPELKMIFQQAKIFLMNQQMTQSQAQKPLKSTMLQKLETLPEQNLSKEFSQTSKEYTLGGGGLQNSKQAGDIFSLKILEEDQNNFLETKDEPIDLRNQNILQNDQPQQILSAPALPPKKKKKKQLFEELFDGNKQKKQQQNNQDFENKDGNTPSGESIEEGFSFDVQRHSNDVIIQTGETKSVEVFIKKKGIRWPNQQYSLKEGHEEHFRKIDQSFQFQGDSEIQKITLKLTPLEGVKGTVISSWKIYINNKEIGGVIPIKAVIS